MKAIMTLFVIVFTLFSFALSAQSTMVEAYTILEQKCTSCHSNTNPQSGLDLEGSGSTAAARALDVRNNLVNVDPANSYASGRGYKYVYPGRPDLSYLFRKLNQNFEHTISFAEGENAEGGTMPPATQAQMSNVEKEMIRQWILYGAPSSGTVVDPQLVEDYYAGNGVESFPDGPPAAPAEGEGFQIKMGPFFVSPAGQSGDELEYFQKHELSHTLDENTEVHRVDMHIGSSSHHFIIYDFDSPSYANNIQAGLREDPYHNGIGLVAAIQEATDLRLPQGTAFKWEDDIILDLNSHYINYSSTQVLKAEVYTNVYTQTAGTAAQEMQTELLVKDNIWIVNDGNEDTETQVVNFNAGEVFVWGLMGHTHQWGTGYKVYKRENGQRGDLIYDGSCVAGNPGCVSPNFDYQHIPLRFINPFMPLTFNFNNGIVHEATYINEGQESVGFGLTSDDEMMVLVMMYVTDTMGVTFDQTTATEDLFNPLEAVQLFPNPMTDALTIHLPVGSGTTQFTLYDMLGQPLRQQKAINATTIHMERGTLNTGMYLYRLENEEGQFVSGKIMLIN